MGPRNDQRVAARRRLEREECDPALVLTNDLNGLILTSRESPCFSSFSKRQSYLCAIVETWRIRNSVPCSPWARGHSRLAILRELGRGERRVGELVARSGLTLSNVSNHLAYLWECGLVERECRGRESHCRQVAGIAEPLAAADSVLATTGERVRACPRYGALRREAA